MISHNIDKNSKSPLHHQIYLDLLNKISSGLYHTGDTLPSEKQLQELYGVSRITVRNAVQQLENRGYVKKEQGIGTLVSYSSANFELRKLSSFSEDITSHGYKPSSILLEFSELIPAEKIKKNLDLKDDETVYYIERKRLKGDLIVGLHKAYIKKVNDLILKKEEFTPKSSLYSILKDRGIFLEKATEILEAKVADDELVQILELDSSGAVFYKERTTYCNQGQPIEYVEIYYRADMYKYAIELDLKDIQGKA